MKSLVLIKIIFLICLLFTKSIKSELSHQDKYTSYISSTKLRNLAAETSVNSSTNGDQSAPKIAYLSGGGYVVVWVNSLNSNDIYMRLFDSNRNAMGGQVAVNTYTTNAQSSPSVAALDNGGFVIVWASYNQLNPTSLYDIYGTVYTSAGVVASNLQPNQSNSYNQQSPSVSAITSGFIVTWETNHLANPPGSNTYNIYGRLYLNNGTAQNSEFAVSQGTANIQYNSNVKGSSSGFIVTWASNQINASQFNIYARAFENSGSAKGNEFAVNSSSGNSLNYPVVAILSNNNYVFAWQGTQGSTGNDIYARMYDNTLTAQAAQFMVNTYSQNEQVSPSISSISGGYFVITWASNNQLSTSSGYDIYYRSYYNSGTAISISIANSVTSANQDSPSVMGTTSGNFVVAWRSQGNQYDIYWNSFSVNTAPTCTNFTVNASPSAATSLDFTNYVSDSQDSTAAIKIVIGSLPSQGSLTAAGSAATVNGQYSVSEITYTSGTSTGSYTLDFTSLDTGNLQSSTCTVTFSISSSCYSSCNTCTSGGNASNNNCSSCVTGYYPRSDLTTNCYNSAPTGYYFNVNTYSPCYSSCSTCTTGGNSSSNNCSACNNNYYPRSDLTTNCYNTAPTGYYLDTNKYSPCYSTCSTCSSGGNSNNNYCSSCANGYFPRSDLTTNCYNSAPTGYYLDTNKYSPCYSSCGTCTSGGNPTNNNCSSCVNGYYPRSDLTSNCYNSAPTGYYFDANKYSPCYSSCSTCNIGGNPSNNNCASCVTGYYPRSDLTSNCYNSVPSGYYFNVNTYSPCYSSCSTCSASGDSTNNNCTSCKTGYLQGTDVTTNCYNSAPTGYYTNGGTYSACYSSCYTCTKGGDLQNNNCDSCATGFYPRSDLTTNCYNSVPVGYYFNINTYSPCYSSCNTCSTSGNPQNNNCSSCKNGYYPRSDMTTNCYNVAPTGYYFDINKYYPCYSACSTCNIGGNTQNNNCSSCANGYYPRSDLTSNCYNSAPLGYYLDVNKYSPCYSSCGTCNSGGNTSNNNCSSCATGFHPRSDLTSNCYNSPPSGYYFDINKYSPCYSNCSTCSTGGDSTNNNCSSCINGYFPRSDLTTNCYNSAPLGYYLDNNKYSPCYSSCKTCTIGGNTNNNNCSSCKAGYLPDSVITTNCYNTVPTGYYLDGNQYSACYSLCYTCQIGGTSQNNNCSSCISGYYPRSDLTTNCYNSAPAGYYLNVNMYSPCYSTCGTCLLAGTLSNNNCSTCANNYFPKSDSTSNCFNTTPPAYYFHAINKMYSPCYASCATCSTNGNSLAHNCSTCATNYYARADLLTNCYNSPPTGYYLNVDNLYTACHSSCSSCTSSGNVLKHNCSTCLTGYFPKSDLTSNCYNATPVAYYFQTSTSQYRPCFSSCNTCSADGTSSNHNCLSCVVGYFPRSDLLSNCYDYTPTLYYFSTNTNHYRPCYNSCGTCSADGDSVNHNCLSCNSGYYPRFDKLNSCYNSAPAGYYYNSEVAMYKVCYNSCLTCQADGTSDNNNCSSCQPGYYQPYDNLSQCLNTPPTNYYLNTLNNLYSRCYSSCSTCTSPGNDTNHNCTTCLNGYYFFSDNSTNCFSSNNPPINYYFDSPNLVFRSCYKSCKFCSRGGNLNNNYCTVCNDNYYSMSDNLGQCVNTQPIGNYYLNTTINEYRPCYLSCATCSADGHFYTNNCLTCKDNFYPLVDNPNQCYSSPPLFYYYNSTLSVHKSCYESCQRCSGDGDSNENNCLTCKFNYNPNSSKPSNCELNKTPMAVNKPQKEINYKFDLTDTNLYNYQYCSNNAQSINLNKLSILSFSPSYYQINSPITLSLSLSNHFKRR